MVFDIWDPNSVVVYSRRAMFRPFVVVLVAAALVGAPAYAAPKKAAPASSKKDKDTTPPVIEHTPITKHDGKGPLVVEAKITDDKSGVFEPTLLVRAAGGGEFQRVTMTPKDDDKDTFTAAVPAELLSGDVEYLIEAFDQSGNGPARAGDENAPLKIVRDAPAPPPPPTPVDKAPAPVKPDDGPSGALLGGGVAVGVVVLLAAVLGGGYAFYALRPAAPSTVSLTVKAPSPLGAAP
jgi:hypothetical protein